VKEVVPRLPVAAGVRATGPTLARIIALLLLVAGAAVAAVAGSALIVFLPYATVGTMLVIRRPRNPIGWLLTAIGWTFALAWLPVSATQEELVSLTTSPVTLAVAWFKWWWSLPLTFTLIAALAITFPTGYLPRSRWGPPARSLLASMAVLTAISALWPAQEIVPGDEAASFWMPNPLGLLPAGAPGTTSGTLPAAVAPAILAMLLIAIVSMLVRYRKSSGIERLQLRWLVAGLGAIILAVPFGFVLFAVFGSGFAFTWLPAIIAFALPPVAIGIAVTRYRLYEIDRIISRTIGWALVSGVLVAVFGGAVLALQAVLSGFTQGQTLAVAASTLVAFALFHPVRRRVQHAVDRRFDRARYDGERTAAAFAERMRDQVDLVDLETDITATVGAALRPSSTELWIRGPHPRAAE
jgi:hypothetical protein